MPTHAAERAPLAPTVPVLAVVVLVVAILVTIATLGLRQPDAARASEQGPPTPAVALAERTGQAAADATATVGREEAKPDAVVEMPFEARVDELIRIGNRTAELAQQDDIAAAKASDQEARGRFADLMERFPDAGQRAVSMLTELAEPASAPRTNGRRVVLQLVIRTELERLDHDATALADRSRIDRFTQVVLDVMPVSAITAGVGEAVLAKERFLRVVHEPGVLHLVRLAAEEQFARATATAILLTLWDNLQRYGERSSAELSRLALLLLGNDDPSQRTAACRQLLKDARYRNLVLAWLRDRNDGAVAKEIATLAANELPPPEALALLRDLAPMLPRATPAYLLVGFRAPDAVADSYRELLAGNTHPGVRADLVTSVGMTDTPLGREIAMLALDHDPDPDVRVQAVFALTSKRDAALGERAILQALDDPLVAGDKGRLAAMVFALENLVAAGDANAIDRVGQRLRALPLFEDSRQRLDALLQRSLPGGAGR